MKTDILVVVISFDTQNKDIKSNKTSNVDMQLNADEPIIFQSHSIS